METVGSGGREPGGKPPSSGFKLKTVTVTRRHVENHSRREGDSDKELDPSPLVS